MGRVTVLVVTVFVAVVAAGCFYLAYGHFPVPVVRVEKVLPDARFPK
jgi:hypothetical protein